MTWTRTDESYYAILGTPNCKGVLWILREHPITLKKTVHSITAFGTNYGTKDKPDWSWEMGFKLARYNPDEDCGCSGLSCVIA